MKPQCCLGVSQVFSQFFSKSTRPGYIIANSLAFQSKNIQKLPGCLWYHLEWAIFCHWLTEFKINSAGSWRQTKCGSKETKTTKRTKNCTFNLPVFEAKITSKENFRVKIRPFQNKNTDEIYFMNFPEQSLKTFGLSLMSQKFYNSLSRCCLEENRAIWRPSGEKKLYENRKS